jgi:hypothetical protein
VDDRASKALAALVVVAMIGAGVSLAVRDRANRAALEAEARAVAPLLEADRALRREDEARAARRAAEERAAYEALSASPEVVARRTHAAEVTLRTGMRADLDGDRLDALVLRDDRCAAVLYLMRMVNEHALDPPALRRIGVRSVRCEGPLGACSTIDVTASDRPEPQRCR